MLGKHSPQLLFSEKSEFPQREGGGGRHVCPSVRLVRSWDTLHVPLPGHQESSPKGLPSGPPPSTVVMR